MDPSIRRTPTTAKVRGKELQGFLYERPFDQRYTNHLLEMLQSVTRFGGQGFAKTAHSTPIRRSQHAGLIQRVEHGECDFGERRTSLLNTVFPGGIPDLDTSYLDLLVELLLR
jgi:hypothetical protein